ncbi:MAG: DUF975 family protein [Ruminococcaceae bacterium]|nr:DUF975 family protein [Oscillospiraceae bacterium]
MNRALLKEDAKRSLSGKWGHCALCTFVLLLLLSVLSAFQGPSGELSRHAVTEFRITWPLFTVAPVWGLILSLIASIATSFLQFGYLDILMNIKAGHPTSCAMLFHPFTERTEELVKMTLLYTAIDLVYLLLVWFFVSLMPLLAIPLILVLSFGYTVLRLRLSFVPMILLESPDTPIWTAFIRSETMMRGYTFQFFVLCLSFLGWAFLAALTLGIGVLWLYPYIGMTVVNFYFEIKNHPSYACNQV